LKGVPLIVDLNLSVQTGSVATIMGPSGCGKSSLLAFICGTLAPAFRAGGRVVLGGQDVTALPPERRRIGILFQDDLLFPHLGVGQNLAFALPAHIVGRAARRAVVERTLSDVGLADFYSRDPGTLSGGQKARVSALRALLAEPEALLLDEPFSKLDAVLRGQFRAFVFDRIATLGIPTLLVTHDPADIPPGGAVIEISEFSEWRGDYA
jgi:putative thiamine transport system ATP-binding protein